MSSEWLEQISKSWGDNQAHMFIVTGNINDITGSSSNAGDRIATLFGHTEAGEKELAPVRTVVKYNPSKGFSFHSKEAEKAFQKMVSNGRLDNSQPSQGGGLASAVSQDSSVQTRGFIAPTTALSYISDALGAKAASEVPEDEMWTQQLCIIVQQGEYVFPNGDLGAMGLDDRIRIGMGENWSLDEKIGNKYHMIFVLSSMASDLNPKLYSSTSWATLIDVPMPNEVDREAVVTGLMQDLDVKIGEDLTSKIIAKQTRGLALRHVEDIFYRALHLEKPLDAALIYERKAHLMYQEYGDVLTVEDPTISFEQVPGHDRVKQWFSRVIIPGLRDGDKRIPSGVLLVGPPGTGKTMLSKAVAAEAGVTFMNLNVGALKNMYVGNSEARLEKAIRAIDQLGGICMIDEIDQQLSSRSDGDTGSGVDNSFLGRLLAFMADPSLKGRVVFLGATNRPDKMDAAIRRSGRFDRKVPILPPEDEDRLRVLATQIELQEVNTLGSLTRDLRNMADGGTAEDKDVAKSLKNTVDLTDGWVQSDLTNLVSKAWELTAMDESDVMIMEACHLEAAAGFLLPSVPDDTMLQMSLQEVNDLSLLPGKYRDRLQKARRPEKSLPAPETSRRRARRT